MCALCNTIDVNFVPEYGNLIAFINQRNTLKMEHTASGRSIVAKLRKGSAVSDPAELVPKPLGGRPQCLGRRVCCFKDVET
jgi:hypothetical protein